MKKVSNIHDVAKEAGVSIKTVSRVINGEPNVTEKTKSKILKAIDTLSYTPSVSARSLASKKSYTILLLCAEPISAVDQKIHFAATLACRAHGYALNIQMFADADTMSADDPRAFFKKPIPDGVILPPPLSDNQAMIKFLGENNIEFVRISPRDVSPTISPCVYIDEQDAASAMTERLIKNGRRRIALLTGPIKIPATPAIIAGYRAAMMAHGGEIDESIMLEGDLSFSAGLEAGRMLFQQDRPPTAIFASSDAMAAGVNLIAHQMGRRIPDDVAVVGFGDDNVAQMTAPMLTTIRRPVSTLSAMAVRLLVDIRMTTMDDSEKSITIDYEIIERQSASVTSPSTASIE